MIIIGYMAFFFSVYNLVCAGLYRLAGNEDMSRAASLECSVWFIAGCIAFK